MPEEKNPAPIEGAEQIRAEVTAAERKRTTDILDAVRKAGLGDDFGIELVKKDITVDQARAEIIERFAAKDPHKGQGGVAKVTVTRDEQETQRRSLADALILRANPGFKLAQNETENRDRTAPGQRRPRARRRKRPVHGARRSG